MPDILRTTNNVVLPTTIAKEIWAKGLENSIVMRLAQRVSLPGTGKDIQMVTGEPNADFIGEGQRAEVSYHSFAKKKMGNFKITVMEPFSREFRRDLSALYDALAARLPLALATTFDKAVLHGEKAPTANFDTFKDAPQVAINTPGNVYKALVDVKKSIAVDAFGDVTGWVMSPAGEATLLGEVDGNKRPLFTTNIQTDGAIGYLLGAPVYKARAVYGAKTTAVAETLGLAVDWSKCYFGIGQDITYEELDQPVYNKAGALVHAGAQDDMFTVKASFEVGFVMEDPKACVRLTGQPKG